MHDTRSCTRTAPRAPPTVHLAATSGGHLDLLMGLSDSFAAYRRVWVVSPGSATDALAADGEKVILLPRFHGLTRRNARLGLCSLRPALRERPRLVVTSGSGSVVPFCLAARALGARIVFIETMARTQARRIASCRRWRMSHSSSGPRGRGCTRGPTSAGQARLVRSRCGSGLPVEAKVLSSLSEPIFSRSIVFLRWWISPLTKGSCRCLSSRSPAGPRTSRVAIRQ